MNRKRNKGLFITLEGGEGAGKSTLMEKLKKALNDRGEIVIKTREPGGSKLGEMVRNLLLSHDPDVKIGAMSELLLFLSARAQHIEELIKPALQKGQFVLCDRFNDSTIAYQGGARGLDLQLVKQLCSLVCGSVNPDLTLYLDIDPSIGLKRANKRSSNSSDRIESEKIEFHQRVRDHFLALAKQEPQRIHVLDAGQSKEKVFEQAWKLIEKVI